MASTEGTVISQLFYDTSGKFPLGIQDEDWLKGRQQGWLGGLAKDVHPQRGGWDVIVDAKIRDQIPGITEEIIKNLDLSARPVEVGRYEVVFDAASVADLLTNTIGLATQLDRAIGLEANSGGTSYLGPDPMEFLGTMPVGSPLLNVSGNRSMPKGTATVKWDDEGVMPDEFPLITNGRLVDFQTTREQAPWLKSWYQREQRAVQSHGCARSTSALFIPLQQLPNLVMQPAAEPASFESMVAGVKRGYAIFGGRAFPDFQAKNVSGTGGVREIINGRLGDVIHGAGFLFNSMEFWKSVTAVGGASSVQQVSSSSRKGQPTQSSGHHVSAVPITVKNLSIIDMRRRA